MNTIAWFSSELVILCSVIFALVFVSPKNYSRGALSLALGSVLAVLAWVYSFVKFIEADSTPIHLFSIFYINSVLLLMKGLVLIILSFVLIFSRSTKELQSEDRLEHDVLLSIITVLMITFIQSSNLILTWVSFVSASLGLSVLTAFRPKSFLSSEAAIKALYSSFLASFFLAAGTLLFYARTGSFDLVQIRESLQPLFSTEVSAQNVMYLLTAFFFLICTALLWIAGFPFHFLSLDSAEGAPASVANYLLTVPRIAGITFLLKVVLGVFSPLATDSGWSFFEKVDWQPVLFFCGAASMLIGSFGALGQKHVKRLLAYGSVYQVGLVLLGISIRTNIGVATALYYLIVTTMSIMGVFFIFRKISESERSTELSALDGLAKKSPYLNFILALFLLSWVGMPPFSGFFAQFYVFGAVLEQKELALTAIALLSWIVFSVQCLILLGKCFSERATKGSGQILLSKTEVGTLVMLLVPVFALGLIGDPVVRYLNSSLHVISNFL